MQKREKMSIIPKQLNRKLMYFFNNDVMINRNVKSKRKNYEVIIQM